MQNLLSTFPQRRTGTIGLEFAPEGLTAAQAAEKNGRWRIRFHRGVGAPGANSGNSETASASLFSGPSRKAARKIRNMLRGGVGRYCAAVLPMEVCRLHMFELPRTESADSVRRMVLEELAERDSAACAFDYWQIKGQITQRAELDVYCAAAVPQSIVSKAAEVLRLSGYCLTRIDCIPVAAARALLLMQKTMGEEDDSYGIALHIGRRAATFSFVRNETILLSRTLAQRGTEPFYRSLSRSLDLPLPQTEDLVSGLSSLYVGRLPSPLQAVLDEAVAEWLEPLAAEILRSMVFLNRDGSPDLPTTITVMGEGAVVPNLCRYLTDHTAVATRLWTLGGSELPSENAPAAIATALSASGETP